MLGKHSSLVQYGKTYYSKMFNNRGSDTTYSTKWVSTLAQYTMIQLTIVKGFTVKGNRFYKVRNGQSIALPNIHVQDENVR